MQAHRGEFSIAAMCRVLRVHRSGFYAWLKMPRSARAASDEKLLREIVTVYDEFGGIYGSPRVWDELIKKGFRVARKRVERLMREAGLRGVSVYRKPRYVAGTPAVTAENMLEQNFTVPKLDRVWVTDITYIRTLEGWLFLCAVLDLCSRKVVGWSMGRRQDQDLVLSAFKMAVGRRHPSEGLVIHSDQGVQFGAQDVQAFIKEHGFLQSMSRRGNCYDNALMESFFGTLKKELIQGHIYSSHSEARLDVVDYIEGFYNRERNHSSLNGVSPVAFEALYFGT